MPLVANPPKTLYRAAGMCLVTNTIDVINFPPSSSGNSSCFCIIKKRVVLLSEFSILEARMSNPYICAANADAIAALLLLPSKTILSQDLAVSIRDIALIL